MSGRAGTRFGGCVKREALVFVVQHCFGEGGLRGAEEGTREFYQEEKHLRKGRDDG